MWFEGDFPAISSRLLNDAKAPSAILQDKWLLYEEYKNLCLKFFIHNAKSCGLFKAFIKSIIMVGAQGGLTVLK